MAHTPEIAVPSNHTETGGGGSLFSRLRTRRSAARAETTPTRRRKAAPTLPDLLEAAGPGWHVLDDVSLGRSKIDHVLIGPGGGFVVAIEEGGGLDRKQIVLVDESVLDRVEGDREALERVSGLRFEALVVMSDCWLVGSRFDHSSDVIALPARLLASNLRQRRPQLSTEEASEIADTLRDALDVGSVPTIR